MSDTSQGEGWWQASDLKWYPPETHPSYRPPPPRPDPPQAQPPLAPPAPATPFAPPPVITPSGAQYPAPPTDDVAKRRRFAALALGGGAALIGIGSFLPWAKVTVPFFGSITQSGIDGGDGWISLVLGGLLGVVAWRFFVSAKAGRRAPMVLAIVLAVGALGLTVFEWVDIENKRDDLMHQLSQDEEEEDFPSDLGFSLFTVKQGVGLYAIGIGSLAGIAGALAYKQPPKEG